MPKFVVGQVVNHTPWEGHPPVPVRITKVHEELSALGKVIYEVFPDRGTIVEYRLSALSKFEATGTE